MAETPRTDADAFWIHEGEDRKQFQGNEYCRACTARQLETELNELKRQLAEAETHVRIFRAQAEERGRIIETTRLQLETAAARIEELRKVLVDDSYAITFQSMGQYRTALLNILEERK